MQRRWLLFTLVPIAAILGACQLVTGTGDLEVRDGGAGAGAAASGAGAAGGQGGAGGAVGTGSGASGTVTSSDAASSGTGGGCATCKTTFETAGDPSRICKDNEMNAYNLLHKCLCGDGGIGGDCSGMVDDCAEFCGTAGGGTPPSAICIMCAKGADACSSLYFACVGMN